MDFNNYSNLFNAQQKYFHSVLKKERLYARKEKLILLKKWIKQNQLAIQKALFDDFKKSPEEVLITEIKPVIGEINLALKQLRDWAKEEKVKAPLSFLGTRSKIIKEPKGVCLIIAPWNFPFMLAIGPIVSAIAAGNTAVLKPSEMTPNTANLLASLVSSVFIKENVTTIKGGVLETQELLLLPWNHIFFTGSPQVGKIVMEKAANHLTSVTLELGGKNPLLITDKKHLRKTAKRVIWGKFLNNGQSCVSPNYILIPSSIKKEFIQELKFEFVEMYGNYPQEIKTKAPIARVVNTHHFNRLKALLESAITDGGKVVFGNNLDESENYISPTILDNITTGNSIFKEEIFGPILPIITYETLNDALVIINKEHPPLALYIFSQSKKIQQHIIKNTSAGTTVINDTTLQFAHPNLPFGGVGYSGMGKAHGEFGFLEFSNKRAVLKQRNFLTTAQLIYPKYSRLKKMIIRFITWNE